MSRADPLDAVIRCVDCGDNVEYGQFSLLLGFRPQGFFDGSHGPLCGNCFIDSVMPAWRNTVVLPTPKHLEDVPRVLVDVRDQRWRRADRPFTHARAVPRPVTVSHTGCDGVTPSGEPTVPEFVTGWRTLSAAAAAELVAALGGVTSSAEPSVRALRPSPEFATRWRTLSPAAAAELERAAATLRRPGPTDTAVPGSYRPMPPMPTPGPGNQRAAPVAPEDLGSLWAMVNTETDLSAWRLILAEAEAARRCAVVVEKAEAISALRRQLADALRALDVLAAHAQAATDHAKALRAVMEQVGAPTPAQGAV